MQRPNIDPSFIIFFQFDGKAYDYENSENDLKFEFSRLFTHGFKCAEQQAFDGFYTQPRPYN